MILIYLVIFVFYFIGFHGASKKKLAHSCFNVIGAVLKIAFIVAAFPTSFFWIILSVLWFVVCLDFCIEVYYIEDQAPVQVPSFERMA